MKNKLFGIVKNNRKYIYYGLSIVLSRGLEYFVLFYAAFYLSKEEYGELEFYKKIIELCAVALAFGLPSLLLTYTKSKNSKVYLNLLSFLFIFLLAVILYPVFLIFDFQFLLIPVVFHAIFFNNGIIPVFFITTYGSNKASIYKSIVSMMFYIGVFLLLLIHPEPEKVFVVINYYLISIGVIAFIILYKKYDINQRLFKRYYHLFKKLLISSLTLVVSNFANIMFLYTDIMILKIISPTANTDMADYSFALNIANMLILIPLTMVQVDIEQIKNSGNSKRIASNIFKYVLIFSFVLFTGYILLINTFYSNYEETLFIFIIILGAKIFQTQTVLYGAILLIKRKFKINLIINVSVVLLNLFLSYILFLSKGVIGIAFASLICLLIRFFIVRFYSKK